MNLNESPAFLLLDTNITGTHKDLPVSLYESGDQTFQSTLFALPWMALKSLHLGSHVVCFAELHNVDGTQQFIFVLAEYTIQTSEAERIGVNQVARVLPAGNDSGSDQCEPSLTSYNEQHLHHVTACNQ